MSIRMRMRMSLSLSFVIRIYIAIFIDSYFSFCFFIFFFKYNIKISYYWQNGQETLQKAKERHSKEKDAQYYKQNKQVIKEKSIDCYKNLSEKEKTTLKSIKRKDIKN